MEKFSPQEIFQQSLFGNELIKKNGKCILFNGWINICIKYIKDVFTENGEFLSMHELYERLEDNRNTMMELHFIRMCVGKFVKNADTRLANHTKSPDCQWFVNRNTRYNLINKKCNFFYGLLKQYHTERNHMEYIWSERFNFPNSTTVWKSIYKQKLLQIVDVKLREFNYKILCNIVPCGCYLAKWNKEIKPNCDACGMNESIEHMIFQCSRIYCIWKIMFKVMKMEAKWKTIVCGFVQREKSKKIQFFNLICSKIAYLIFKLNSKCKFEKMDYKNVNIKEYIKVGLIHFKESMELTKYGIFSKKILNECIDSV